MRSEDYDWGSIDHLACLYAVGVRNALEDLHAGDGPIDDDLMMNINQRVRRGLYEVLNALDYDDEPALSFYIASIPNYWEMPSTYKP